MNEVTDTSLLHLTLYVLVMGVIVEATYQKIKLLWDRTVPAQPVPRPLAQSTQSNYGYGPPMEEPAQEAKRKPADLKDELIPLVLGGLVVLVFYPSSVFQFLPFYPRWPWLDLLLTAILISRGANLAHETYRDFGHMVSGLIGRVFRWGAW